MVLPKHSTVQALSVILLAWSLVHCQAALDQDDEEEEQRATETNVTTELRKTEPVKCPSGCSCTTEGTVDCAGVDLVDFPAKLCEKTRQLSLQVGF